MDISEMLEKVKDIQNKLLSFLEDEDNNEENFQNFKDIFKDQQTIDKYLLLLLHLIAQIANNHHRGSNFIQKIERIILIYKTEIKQKFINSSIFHIFKNNKRILLFLLKEQILIFDNYIYQEIMKKKYKDWKYPEYFYPEIKPFTSLDEAIKKEQGTTLHKFDKLYQFLGNFSEKLPDNFEEKREIGENDEYISQLIREDNIEDFISHISKKDISLQSRIVISIYETNQFLLEKSGMHFSNTFFHLSNHLTLIEYAAFYGSIQIFKYLEMNGVELTQSLWEFAIHSDNPELISHLEEKLDKLEDDSIEDLFIKSIECHHNDIANYINKNYRKEPNKISTEHLIKSLEYYNFLFIDNKKFNSSLFHDWCKFDYCCFIEEFMKTKKVDVNKLKSIDLNNNKDGMKTFEEKKSALHFAIGNNNFETVKLLLTNNEIDVNLESFIRDDSSKFAFFYELNEWEEWGKNVIKNITPLIFAIEKGYNDIIKLLLSSRNIDINHKCYFYREVLLDGGYDYVYVQPIYAAIKYQNVEIVKLLLSNEKFENELTIDFKSYKPDEEFITRIYQHKSLLHTAIDKGNVEIVKLLLETGKFDINYNMKYSYYTDNKERLSIKSNEAISSILYTAVRKNSYEIVKLLLSFDNIDVNFFNLYTNLCSLFDDCETWSESRVKGFDEKLQINCKKNIQGFNYEYYENTVFHKAIKNSNAKIAKLLMSNEKVDVTVPYKYTRKIYNLQDQFNPEDSNDSDSISIYPMLYLAIENGDIECVKLLLSNEKIDVNSSLIYSSKPWTFEINNEKESNKKDKLNIENMTTSLDLAVSSNQIKIVKLLLANDKIDINKKTKRKNSDINNDHLNFENYSPVYSAYREDHADILKLFLSNEKLEINPHLEISFDEETDGSRTKKTLSLSLIDLASISKQMEYVKLFIESKKFDLSIIPQYLEINEDPKSLTVTILNKGRSPLFDLICNDNIDIIKALLLDENIDVNNKFQYEQTIVKFDDLDSWKNYCLTKEIKNRSHIKSFSYYNSDKRILQYAIELEKKEIVKLLLSNDQIDVNAVSIVIKNEVNQEENTGKIVITTPLIEAVRVDDADIVKYLLSNKNININTCYYKFSSPYKFEDENSDDKNPKIFCFTPLEYASLYSKTEIPYLLSSYQNNKEKAITPQ